MNYLSALRSVAVKALLTQHASTAINLIPKRGTQGFFVRSMSSASTHYFWLHLNNVTSVS